MRLSLRIAVAIGFLGGLGLSVATAGSNGTGSGGLQGFPNAAVGTNSPLGSGCTVTATGINCTGIDAGALNVYGAATFGGAVAVTTPSDLTIGVGSDIVLGNAATSAIRGGLGLIRSDDVVGIQLTYGNSVITMDGKTAVQGDTTSPTRSAFKIVPQDAEPTGASEVGDMYVTTAGVLKICTVAGTPGTWVSVGAQ